MPPSDLVEAEALYSLRLRGRWWLLASPEAAEIGQASLYGDPLVSVEYLREKQAIAEPEAERIVPASQCGTAICPPPGTWYRVVYLAALPARSDSQHHSPTRTVLQNAGLWDDLQNISQPYVDLFSAINEVNLLPLELGMPVRVMLWVPERFVVDRAGVLRYPADIEQYPDLGEWEQGTPLDRLLRWYHWWTPEPVAADWAPEATRHWLEEYNRENYREDEGVCAGDEARLIELAERAGLGEVVAGRAHRCGRPGCPDPVPLEEAVRVGGMFLHERCLTDQDRELLEWQQQ